MFSDRADEEIDQSVMRGCARVIRLVPSREGCRLPLNIGFLPLPVDPRQWRWPAPFAPRALPRFITTMEQSGPRGLSHLCLFPWHRRLGSHVPYKSLVELRAAYMPDAAWAVSV